MTPDELAERIERRPFSAERQELMQKIVFVAQRHSMIRTPVRYGTLRRSETTRVESGGLRGFVGTNIKYAPFVHDGTRYMPARPFFALGIADSRAEVQTLLQQAGDAYFRKIAS